MLGLEKVVYGIRVSSGREYLALFGGHILKASDCQAKVLGHRGPLNVFEQGKG